MIRKVVQTTSQCLLRVDSVTVIGLGMHSYYQYQGYITNHVLSLESLKLRITNQFGPGND